MSFVEVSPPSERIGVQMNQKCLELSLIAVLIGGASVTPARAEYRTSKDLPDASHIHPSRLKAEIVDLTPIVTDNRKVPEDTRYVINVPPMPAARHNVVTIGDGGTPGAASQSVPITTNLLPNAGFGSNIPAQGMLAHQSLPPGTSTSGLKNVAAQRLPKTGPIASSKPFMAKPAQAAAVPTADYDRGSGATAAGAQHVTTGVVGELQRHSLLK